MKDRGMVSLFYKTLLAGLKEGSQSYLSAWKRDFQVDITVEEWEHACLSAQTQSINTRCRILQYKWMMRTYITPVKLHRINPNIPDNCAKCKDEIGTLFHCMWECREMQMFWKEVLGVVCEMTRENIPLESKLCLLHTYPESMSVNASKKKLIDFSLIQAKRVIALVWKKHPKTCSFTVD